MTFEVEVEVIDYTADGEVISVHTATFAGSSGFGVRSGVVLTGV